VPVFSFLSFFAIFLSVIISISTEIKIYFDIVLISLMCIVGKLRNARHRVIHVI